MSSESLILLSDEAKKYILDLKKNDPDLIVYISISGGGCSGFQYIIEERYTKDIIQNQKNKKEENIQSSEDDSEDDWDDEIEETHNDIIIMSNGSYLTELPQNDNSILVIVDGYAIPQLKGSNIYLDKNDFGEEIKIDNPNAKANCGCGISFNT